MRRYIREGTFYPSLYESDIGQDVFKPCAGYVEKYFTNSEMKTVNEQNYDFHVLLARVIEIFMS